MRRILTNVRAISADDDRWSAEAVVAAVRELLDSATSAGELVWPSLRMGVFDDELHPGGVYLVRIALDVIVADVDGDGS